jgi:hypothetical protein
MMRKTHLILVAGFCLLIVGLLHPAWANTAFGPKTYTRPSGPPQIITDNFSVADTSLSYTLVLTNNNLSDSATDSATDSFIYLNDTPIVGTHNFNQSVTTLEIPVTLQASNTLEVEVRGAAGGSITIEIVSNP